MKAQYLKFFKKFFILLVVMFIVDRGLGSIIEYYFQNEPLGDAASFAHAINDPQEEVLIYGASRAVHTYDTKLLPIRSAFRLTIAAVMVQILFTVRPYYQVLWRVHMNINLLYLIFQQRK